MLLIEHLAVSALLFPSHAGPLASLPLACTGSEAAAGRPSRCGTSRTRSRRKVREGAFTKKIFQKHTFFQNGKQRFSWLFLRVLPGASGIGQHHSCPFCPLPLLPPPPLYLWGPTKHRAHKNIFVLALGNKFISVSCSVKNLTRYFENSNTFYFGFVFPSGGGLLSPPLDKGRGGESYDHFQFGGKEKRAREGGEGRSGGKRGEGSNKQTTSPCSSRLKSRSVNGCRISSRLGK